MTPANVTEGLEWARQHHPDWVWARVEPHDPRKASRIIGDRARGALHLGVTIEVAYVLAVLNWRVRFWDLTSSFESTETAESLADAWRVAASKYRRRARAVAETAQLLEGC